MASLTTINNGTPGVTEHSVSELSSLDAIEALKAIQGIINALSPNSDWQGRLIIPTPELSPVPKFRKLRERGDGIVNADQAGVNEEGDLGEMEEPTSDGPTLTAHVLDTEDTHSRDDIINTTSTTEPNLPTTAIAKCSKQPPPSSTEWGSPDPKQDRLRYLTDTINRNICQLSTTDDAGLRVKTATAALELANAVRPPSDTIMSWFTSMSIVSAVRLFQHWGAFEAIPSGPGESITYAELARRIDADEGLVGMSPSPLSSFPNN